jgi:hypothetical protein
MGIDATVPGCGEEVLASDGTLCPSVAAPGATLSSAQADRLVAAIRNPDPEVRGTHLRCGFEPHHAFVFYDAKGAPIADLLVCFTCGEWRARPEPKGIGQLMGKAGAEMRALCRELNLGGCFVGVDETEKKVWDARKRLHEAEKSRPKAPGQGMVAAAGIDAAKPIKDLTATEKRKLCASFAHRLTSETSFRLESGFECENDRGVGSFLDLASCSSRMPPCDTPIGKIEPCMNALLDDVCLTEPAASSACAPVRSCMWGLRWIKTPGSAPRAAP